MSHSEKIYRGRLAPSPTGHLHLGHARTFWIAQQRARSCGGTLVLRNEDLDAQRFKMEFVESMIEDMKWFGFEWSEGPDCGGAFGPYNQSERVPLYQEALEGLRAGGFLYPCVCSRKDIQAAVRAPHADDDLEPVYPGTCRGRTEVRGQKSEVGDRRAGDCVPVAELRLPSPDLRFNWRFRVPDGEVITFEDGQFGPQRFETGKHIGDFVVWRGDGVPSYQLACVVDDASMGITEVVRGEDLLRSTARQLLLYRALNLPAPKFFHCPLMKDASGVRLAKRHDALSLRQFRAQGVRPEQLRADW
jgi:glutamyl-tRNA synthetase